MVESDRGQERMKQVAGLLPIAEELGTSPSKLAIAWCLLNERVSSVILGASRVEQLEENLKAVEVLPLLTDEVKARLAAI
jgi:aryl-alcohol dehydrogenase-like predicted oxidoreductase